jgi:hypothetical protein
VSQDINAFSGRVSPSDTATVNLLQYLQSLNPEVVAQLSRPESPEILQVMESNIQGLLGGLSGEHFQVEITTSRENLAQLLVSAVMGGYFLRNVEQRFAFEQAILSGTAEQHD